MERLWSPWRYRYVSGTGEPHGCVFCEAARATGPDGLLLARGRTCFVILNLYPYNSGHLMVVSNRHVPSLGDLDREERAELIEVIAKSECALNEAYRPQGMNIGMNLGRSAGAGIVDHLHVHLVPRWTGDTNFMSVVGQVRVLPEELEQTAERLRPIFARLEV